MPQKHDLSISTWITNTTHMGEVYYTPVKAYSSLIDLNISTQIAEYPTHLHLALDLSKLIGYHTDASDDMYFYYHNGKWSKESKFLEDILNIVNTHVCDSTKYLSQIKAIREDIATANRLNCKCTRLSRLFNGKCVCVKQDILNNLNKELDNLIAGI